MMKLFVAIWAVYIMSAAALHYCAFKRGAAAILVSKTAASAVFLLLGIAGATLACNSRVPCIAGSDVPLPVILMVIGLIFGFIGDVVLAMRRLWVKKKLLFIGLGMLSFAIGHVFYLLSFGYLLPISVPVWCAIAGFSLLTAGAYVILAPKLKLEFGRLKPFILIYSGLLVCMAASAAMGYIQTRQMTSLLFFIGGVCFLISDMILSQMYFDRDRSKSGKKYFFGVHSTYYLAQGLIATALWLI